MLSALKYTIYYVMSCVLLMRFFCHYVILERVGFFLYMVLLPPLLLLFSRELVVLKTVLYNR